MKKVLATVAALGLVVGVTSNALALDKPSRASEVESTTAPAVPKATAPGVALWSVSGQWVLAGAYLSKGMGAPGGAAVTGTPTPLASDGADAFYIYSFKVLPVLQINDKISVKGEYRVVDRGVLGATDLGQTSLAKWYTVYMEYNSPYGKTRFGRTPAGAWGTSKFNNSTRQGQRLMWWMNMLPENFGSLIFTEKLTEADATAGSYTTGKLPDFTASNTTAFAASSTSDGDRDAYYVDLSYKADIGKTVGALWVVRQASSGGPNATPATAAQNAPYTSMNFWLNGKYNFGDWTVEYEGDFGFGDASATADQSSIAFMADVSYNMGDMKFGGLFLYCSGDNDTDNDAETACANTKGTGRDYNPFQIMMGDYMNMWNADNPLAKNTINPALKTDDVTGMKSNVGLTALAAYGSYKVSPKMSISGELGWFMANEERSGWDDDLGWEFGMGLSYKIYDNLTYGAHFSYLFTGDFFQWGDSTVSTEDIYLLAHALSMKF